MADKSGPKYKQEIQQVRGTRYLDFSRALSVMLCFVLRVARITIFVLVAIFYTSSLGVGM